VRESKDTIRGLKNGRLGPNDTGAEANVCLRGPNDRVSGLENRVRRQRNMLRRSDDSVRMFNDKVRRGENKLRRRKKRWGMARCAISRRRAQRQATESAGRDACLTTFVPPSLH